MKEIRWTVLWMLGLVVFMGCKRQPKELLRLPERIFAIPENGGITGWTDLPLSDSVLLLPDTKTEQRLKFAGFVDLTGIDPSIEVCLMYATTENFTGQVLYTDLRKAFLLPEAARRVADAQRRLKAVRPRWSLIIYDAARPMSVQQVMWDKVKNTDKQVYVSNPSRGGGLHNYGAAVDVSLIDETGQSVDMGSPVDYFGDEARPDREDMLLEQGRISPSALENRRLLRRVMQEAGFRPLRSEWWHFNLMNREEAREKLIVIP